MNTLRYIHANPKAANMQQGWFYDFSNYGSYDRLTSDGLTQWHPAFLLLGKTLEICAAAYRKFCKEYKPQPKPERKSHWGSKLLAGLKLKKKSQKASPGQLNLWEQWEAQLEEAHAITETFLRANSYNPDYAISHIPCASRCQVSDRAKADSS
ncbi:hypothetical protein [Vacuolonema iberomarrocanum]|uniref:hypothetical protein n=1 Tax=Vacuolonema iberomarrocanum TaxID=3454632 RepID=UPI003F6DBA91